MHLLRDMSRRVSRRKGIRTTKPESQKLEAESRHPTRTLFRTCRVVKDQWWHTHHISVSQTSGDQSKSSLMDVNWGGNSHFTHRRKNRMPGGAKMGSWPNEEKEDSPKPKADRKQKVRYRVIEDFRSDRSNGGKRFRNRCCSFVNGYTGKMKMDANEPRAESWKPAAEPEKCDESESERFSADWGSLFSSVVFLRVLFQKVSSLCHHVWHPNPRWISEDPACWIARTKSQTF